jgi:hypothetical protein
MQEETILITTSNELSSAITALRARSSCALPNLYPAQVGELVRIAFENRSLNPVEVNAEVKVYVRRKGFGGKRRAAANTVAVECKYRVVSAG